MGYCERQLLLSMEIVKQIEKELSRLIREGTVARELINDALQRRDPAVEEVQVWEQWVKDRGARNERLYHAPQWAGG